VKFFVHIVCVNFDLSLLEEHAVRVLRTGCWGEYFNFGWGQVTGSLMKMCTEEFHALHICTTSY